MARSGVAVDETISCVGIGAGEATDRLLELTTASGQYRAVGIGPDRFQFARSYRPTWSLVCTFLFIWLAGLGLLFLLVKSAETWVASIEQDHRSTRIRVTGRILPNVLVSVRSALQGEVRTPATVEFGRRTMADQMAQARAAEPMAAPLVVPPPGMSPPPVAPSPVIAPPPGHAGAVFAPAPVPPVAVARAAVAPAAVVPTAVARTPVAPTRVGHAAVAPTPTEPVPVQSSPVAPAAPAPTTEPTGGSTPGASLWLELDTGERIEPGAFTLVGRDPSPAPGEPVPVLISVDDPARSVSKTHVALVLQEDGVRVLDRHSTNGTKVEDASGSHPVAPDNPLIARAGATVRFGDRWLRVLVADGVAANG